LTQFADGRSGDAAPGNVCRDPVAELRDALSDEDQVEPAQHGAVVADENVVGAGAGRLLGEPGGVLLGELGEVLVAPVRDRCGEVGAIDQLERQDRLRVVGAQALQLRHHLNATQVP
jgi:hypothetical protein